MYIISDDEEKKLAIARPVLKWAGGKQQLLPHIIDKFPSEYGKYIEPFIGGGAVFFYIKSKNAVISDLNPELINLYKVIACNVNELISRLKQHVPIEEHFYEIRAQRFHELSSLEAAARTIYLNKTCFNGLFRVNKLGQFNVPFSKYCKSNICCESELKAASELLRKATIECDDYKNVLNKYAKPNDLIFLDPPYLPISKYSDFKRYTKEQFHQKDHVELSREVERLQEMGCFTILTNSNHPFICELYKKYKIEVVQTRRSINAKADGRKGEDIIVAIPPKKYMKISTLEINQVDKYPPTRFMGSKRAILPHIWAAVAELKCNSVLDLFSGSGIVAYMFKAHGKTVYANDYMRMNSTLAKALTENNSTTLKRADIMKLVTESGTTDKFVQKTFKGLYYTDEDNQFIDVVRTNIKHLNGPYKKAIAMSALIRSCVKKRPRGIFTYIGERYNDGRRDLRLSIKDQYLEAVDLLNGAVFNNNRNNVAMNKDALNVDVDADLVYMDPPYYSPLSDNEYVRRYHFLEGLARNWEGVDIQMHTKTKKFKSYPTPFSTCKGAYTAFDQLFEKYKKSILVISYSSNSLPTQAEIIGLLRKYKKKVDVIEVDHQYSFGTHKLKLNNIRNKVREYLFVAS